MNLQNKVIIVGAGTAGLICALYLQKHSPNNITVIKSSSIGIVGVGEGSTEHWAKFMNECDIDFKELIVETEATIKIGILFDNWNHIGSQYVHSITENPGAFFYNTLVYFNQKILTTQNPSPFLLSTDFEEIYFKNKIPLYPELKSSNQYHFDTFKLNSYLTKKCKERGVNIVEATIEDITLNNQGNINTLITQDNTTINGDFFVDCTGFKKVLMSKLGAKWISYSKYLPMNHAITFPTNLPLNKKIEPYTRCTALSSGWVWKIPTQTRYGNGYVFNDNFINSTQALDEFNNHLNVSYKEPSKDIKFEAGKINNFWVKNCVAIGLASGFSEPLEAQSIGLSILQSSLLAQMLPSWKIDQKSSTQYNLIIDKIFNNIIDYLQVHYMVKRNDSKFWKNNNFTLTNFNQETIKLFSSGAFSPNYFEDYLMFKSPNFYQVYYGLGLLTKEKILKHSNNFTKDHHKYTLENYLSQKPEIPNSIDHWEYLKLIKENHSS